MRLKYIACILLVSCGSRNSFVETTAPGLQLEPDETDNFMDISTVTGQLPRHQYVWIDTNFTHKQPHGFIPAVWFGLVSMPGRTWGCTVMLECGAIYRNLEYLFSVAPVEDAFSYYPEQAKEFTFVKLKNDRLTIQPTDFTLFNEKSFTDGKMEFPKGVKRQTKVHHCE